MALYRHTCSGIPRWSKLCMAKTAYCMVSVQFSVELSWVCCVLSRFDGWSRLSVVSWHMHVPFCLHCIFAGSSAWHTRLFSRLTRPHTRHEWLLCPISPVYASWSWMWMQLLRRPTCPMKALPTPPGSLQLSRSAESGVFCVLFVYFCSRLLWSCVHKINLIPLVYGYCGR